MFGHTFSGYGNQNLGGVFQAQPSREIPANALSNVQQPDYPLSFDQYSGEPLRMLAEIVWQVGIMDKSDFFLTDILPVQETNKLTADLNMTIFEPKLMDTNPEWSQAKLVSFSKRQRRKRLIRRGLQMELEQGFADTEYGRDTFNRYVMTIIKSQRDTLSTEILLALEQAPLDTEDLMLKKDPRWRGMTTADYMSDEVFFYGIMQKNARPFEALDARIRKNMAFVDGQYDTLIVPSHVTGYTKSVKDKYLDYNMAGPSGQALSRANPDNNDDKGLYPGISGNLIVPLRPTFEQYRMNHGAALMTSPFSVGEYYCCKSYIDFSSKYWTPDNQAIEIYDETDSTRKKITLLEICMHSGLFDKDGSLLALDSPNMPYREYKGDLNVDWSKGYYDMWSDENGKPLRLFGEMHQRSLSSLDIVQWAKAVSMRLKKESNLTAEKWATMELAWMGDVDAKGTEAAFDKQLENLFPESEPSISQAAAEQVRKISQTRTLAMPAGTVPVWRRPDSLKPDAAYSITNTRIDAMLKKLQLPISMLPDTERLELATAIYAYNIRTGNNYPLLTAQEDITAARAAFKVEYTKESPALRKEITELQSRYKDILKESIELDASKVPLANYFLDNSQSMDETKAREAYTAWQTTGKPPALIPANPESTGGWLPMSLEDLNDYFAEDATNDWPPTSFTLGSHLAALHRLIQSNDGTHDAALADLHSNAHQGLRSMLRSMSIGDQGEGFLVRPRRVFSSEEAAEIMGVAGAITSDSFQRNWKHMELLSGLPRIIALKFLFTRIHQKSIIRWAELGLPLPFQGVIFRPNITHRVSHAIACMRGRANLGHTLIGKAKFTYGSDPGPQSIMGHFTFYSLPVIEKPWNVCVIPAITVDQYLGGKGTQWIDVALEMTGKSEPEQSMLGLIIPLRAEMPMVTSITGSTFDLERVQTLQLKEEPYFPQALRFRMTAGTNKMLSEDMEMQASRPGYNPRNFICWPGKYWFREESEFKGVHEGKGHFGNTDGPDAKFIRGGALAQYVTDAGGANRY